jgi:hypothetical protein
MAQTVKLRRSSTAGKVPTTDNLELGELAINTADGKVYFERGDTSIQTIVTTNSLTSGSLTLSGSDSPTSNNSYVLAVSGSINTFGTGRVFENGTSVVDHATAMGIVFGG